MIKGKCEVCGIETDEEWMTLCKKDYAKKMKEKEETEIKEIPKENLGEKSVFEDMKESIKDTIKLMDEFREKYEYLNFNWDKICNAMFIAKRREK